MSHKYKIKLKFVDAEFGEFTKEEIIADEACGCDAYIYISLLYPQDGSLSVEVVSRDGRKNGDDLSDKELFKIWMMIGMMLAKSEKLDDARKFLARLPMTEFNILFKERNNA